MHNGSPARVQAKVERGKGAGRRELPCARLGNGGDHDRETCRGRAIKSGAKKKRPGSGFLDNHQGSRSRSRAKRKSGYLDERAQNLPEMSPKYTSKHQAQLAGAHPSVRSAG